MGQEFETLALDSVQCRRTMNVVSLCAWIRVKSDLKEREVRILKVIQDSSSEAWLQPRHHWQVKSTGELWVWVENVAPEELWRVKLEAKEVAEKALYALNRILDVILATDSRGTIEEIAVKATKVMVAGEGNPPIFEAPGSK